MIPQSHNRIRFVEDRYIKADNNQGWPIAIIVIVLAVAITAGAWYLNQTTHYSPNDVLAPESGGAAH